MAREVKLRRIEYEVTGGSDCPDNYCPLPPDGCYAPGSYQTINGVECRCVGGAWVPINESLTNENPGTASAGGS